MKDHNQQLGQRISEARHRLGISQAELAEAAGFSALQIISEIERGNRSLRASELARLARALHVSVSDLLTDEELEKPLVLWRRRPENATHIEAEFVKKCQDYKLLEELTGYLSKQSLPLVDCEVDELNYSRIAWLAANTAETFKLGHHPAASLVTVMEEDYGVKIWYRASDGGSAASAMGNFGPAILMNSEEPPWRRNFSFAHELFHLITWKSIPPFRLMRETDLWERVEKFANSFASCLLLPTDKIISEFDRFLVNDRIRVVDLIALARQFEVSTEALLWRFVTLHRLRRDAVERLLGDPAFRTRDRLTTQELWDKDKPPKMPERFVRMAFLAFERGDLSRARLAQLLGVSLIDLNTTLNRYGLDESQIYEAELTASS